MRRDLNPARWPVRYGAGVLTTLICLGGTAFGSAHNFRVDVPLPNDVTIAAVHAWDGYLWIGTNKGLYRCKPDGTSLDGPAALGGPAADTNQVWCLREHCTYLLVGGYNGLFQVRRAELEPHRIADPITMVQAVEAHETGLWVSGRIRGSNNLYYVSDLLGHDHKAVFSTRFPEVRCLMATGEGLWIGSSRGLFHLEKLGSEPQKAPFDQQPNLVTAVFISSEQLWYSRGFEKDHLAEVHRWEKSRNVLTTIGHDLGQIICFTDGKEELWMAGEKGLIRMNKDGTCWENIDFSHGKVKVTSIHRDGDTLWLSSENGVYRIDGQNRAKWPTVVTIDSQRYGPHFTGESSVLRWRVADYDWRTAPWLLRPRAVSLLGNELPAVQVGNPEDEHLITSVGPLGSGLHIFRMDVSDVGGTSAHSDWVYAVVIPPWALFALIIGAVVGLVLARRWVATHLGFAEWRVEAVGCDYNIEIPEQTDQPTTLLVGIPKRRVKADGWPPSGQQFEDLRNEIHGHTVLVAADFSQFLFPWATELRGDIGYEANKTVAGQLWIGNAEGKSQSNRIGEITFAGLACLHSFFSYDYENELRFPAAVTWGRWINRLRARLGLRRAPSSLIDLVIEQFSLWGARIHLLGQRAQTKATPEDFFRALREADVVHVLAHGRETELVLDALLTATDLERELAKPGFRLRCRVLVLSACNAGSLRQDVGSFVLPLVKRGVHVVAASSTVKYPALVTFFTTFYQTLFPNWRAQGLPLSEAFRRATDACLPPQGSADLKKLMLKGVNSIVLYGHPGFEFRYCLTFDWYADRIKWCRSYLGRQWRRPPAPPGNGMSRARGCG